MVIQIPITCKSDLDIYGYYFYHANPMARPLKDKALLKRIPLRIMLTADQRELIEKAAKDRQLEMSAWARPILLEAAQHAVDERDRRKKHK